MIEYELEFTQEALDDIKKHQKSGNRPLLKKLEKLLIELKQHPDTSTGQIEKLKHYKEETWSRRINDEHRLVYRIKEDVIVVLFLSVYGPNDESMMLTLYAPGRKVRGFSFHRATSDHTPDLVRLLEGMTIVVRIVGRDQKGVYSERMKVAGGVLFVLSKLLL